MLSMRYIAIVAFLVSNAIAMGDEPTVNSAPAIAPLGTEWKGKTWTSEQAAPAAATMRVKSREGDTGTLVIAGEQGSIWEFDVKFNGKVCRIVATRRIRKAAAVEARERASGGVERPAPVGGVTGTGRFNGSNLVFQYAWQAEPKKVLQIKFVGESVQE